MRICITTESSADLPKELLTKYDIKTIPFTIILGEKMEYDGVVKQKDLFDYADLTGKLPKTSAINYYQYEDFFNALLKDYDAIIHISITSTVTSAVNNCMNVARENPRVYVIDSRCLSTGIGLLCINARELLNEGKSVDEVVDIINKRIPKVHISALLSTLEYLHKGGRCGDLVNITAKLLRIKPSILLKDGSLGLHNKYLALGKPIELFKKYVLDTLEEFNTPDLSRVVLSHTNPSKEILDMAYDLLKERGFKEIIVVEVGATIATYIGPKAIGIYFINDNGEY